MRQAASAVASRHASVSGAMIAIPLDSLCLDTVSDFDIYLRVGRNAEPVLYRERNSPLTVDVLARLRDSNVTEIGIPSSQRDLYCRYVERNLPRILADPSLATREKAGLLYFSVQGLMNEVMTDARSGELIQRSKAVVATTVDFMLQEPAAFENLLHLVSYDYYTYTHSVNVFVFSLSLAQRSGTRQTNLMREVGEGLLLHDVGKSRIDPAIVNSKGKLTPDEWQEMRKHPQYGYEILAEHGGMTDIALDIVLHHHEKLNGKGYPDGLMGDEISPFVRMCTIADIFDALTTRRSYKEAMESFAALKLMLTEMGPDLDPVLVRAFVDMMGNPQTAPQKQG